jgi:hypothetical protein
MLFKFHDMRKTFENRKDQRMHGKEMMDEGKKTEMIFEPVIP